jgi:mannose-6-phosphate isomerase-like protein (cupin superfamily)
MSDSRPWWHKTRAEAETAANEPGRLSALLMRHGSMTLRWYAPPAEGDPQSPHDQDELYIVARGEGSFLREGDRVQVKEGDVVYAGAGEEHRFEDYSKDFATWVIFWGPEGGENP